MHDADPDAEILDHFSCGVIETGGVQAAVREHRERGQHGMGNLPVGRLRDPSAYAALLSIDGWRRHRRPGNEVQHQTRLDPKAEEEALHALLDRPDALHFAGTRGVDPFLHQLPLVVL